MFFCFNEVEHLKMNAMHAILMIHSSHKNHLLNVLNIYNQSSHGAQQEDWRQRWTFDCLWSEGSEACSSKGSETYSKETTQEG